MSIKELLKLFNEINDSQTVIAKQIGYIRKEIQEIKGLLEGTGSPATSTEDRNPETPQTSAGRTANEGEGVGGDHQ